jgi:hypothetical protein
VQRGRVCHHDAREASRSIGGRRDPDLDALLSDVAAEHLGARLCGVDGPAYADLFDELYVPDRASARWPAWRSAYSQAPVGDDGRARP